MPDFQFIFNNGASSKFIYWTITTSYLMNGVPTYNVVGVDSTGNNYTAIMTRSRKGEFLINNLQQTDAT